jgi:hypothetical protein
VVSKLPCLQFEAFMFAVRYTLFADNVVSKLPCLQFEAFMFAVRYTYSGGYFQDS